MGYRPFREEQTRCVGLPLNQHFIKSFPFRALCDIFFSLLLVATVCLGNKGTVYPHGSPIVTRNYCVVSGSQRLEIIST